MSNNQPLGLKELFDVYQPTLRLVGAANATGAITAGAAFHALPEAQWYVKYVALIFLMGVFFFAASCAGLFFAQMHINSYLVAIQTADRTEWEKIFVGTIKTPPDEHLSEAKKAWIATVLFSLCSFVLFMAGLLSVLYFIVPL